MFALQEKTGDTMVRVLVVAADGLFGRGVEALLRREAEFEVVGFEADAECVVETTQCLRPEVVMIVQRSCALPDASGVVERILKAGARRVIALNPEDNTMHVDGREQRMVRQANDLLDAIREISYGDKGSMPGCDP